MLIAKWTALGTVALISLAGIAVTAQVVAPVEIRDAEIRTLQQAAMPQLTLIGKSIARYPFRYPFYFSRKLDIDERQQKAIDQHSIRFERYNGATVIAISGNYYCAYASDRFNNVQRAEETLQKVVIPILQTAVPAFEGNLSFQGYAVEVSHHVLSKTMGMPLERSENLMVYLPRESAEKLVQAQTTLAQQAALIDAQVYLNANPVSLWLSGEEEAIPAPAGSSKLTRISSSGPVDPNPAMLVTPEPAPTGGSTEVTASEKAVTPIRVPEVPAPAMVVPVRDISPHALANLQVALQGSTNHLVKDVDNEAHFIPYAPPAVIAFRHKAYLELSLSTNLKESAEGSRYRLAAEAFDEHISPLIRRVLAYFPGDQGLDGISFSTTVRGRVKPGVASTAGIAVEYFFPLESLRQYEAYDLTGQQLLDAGIVLINGERAGVDLQIAEGSYTQQVRVPVRP